MTRTKAWLTAVAGLLLLAACGREEVPETPASFRSISPAVSSVTIPEGGSVELDFFVKDINFLFNYDVQSPSCQISLRRSGGSVPEYFAITSVRKTDSPGGYTAVISDRGVDPDYQEKVCLAMLVNPGLANESLILSGEFTVQSEAAADGRLRVRTGLPVVYIDTDGGKAVDSKDVFRPGTVSIKSFGQYEDLPEMACEIRGRGNTTWWWPKKPYLLRLSEKQHIFGMHKHKRWVLLANFMDRTLMRNIVSMKVASMTSLAWTPGCVPVELVLNGKHMGNYLLIEQVRVDNHRVDISKEGYLLELDFHYDNEVQWIDPHGRCNQRWDGIPFAVKYPDADSLTATQTAYIKKYISDAATALYGSNFKDPDKGYAQYIDIDSFIDYWIVFEVMGNHELGNPGSVFFHKEKGGKLVAGPCWDFDWGVLSYRTSPQARTGLVNGNAIWYARLFEDPAFKAKVKTRFQELLPQLETIPSYIDETEALLQKSADLNFNLWDPAEDASQNGGSIINGDENLSFHEAVVRLRTIYEERLEVIQKNL